MLAEFLTKSLQGVIFARFCVVIMGWKHVNTLQMRPPANKGVLEIWLRIHQGKKEPNTAWIQNENILNPAWIQKEKR